MLLQLKEPNQASPKPTEIPLAIGIDLGTTHSLAAYKKGDENVRILTDTLSSIVSYKASTPIVGEQALSDLDDTPNQVITSIKRLMGKSVEDIKGTIEEHLYPLSKGTETNKNEALTLLIKDQPMTPFEVSADILKELKKQAEDTLGESVTQAVITVPAYFDDAARTATKNAARLAGLEILRLVNEPTAAALAYGLDQGSEGLYAVFDLGGGTFDFSLLNLQKGVFQVLASNGDAHLGGDDFDQALLKHLAPQAMDLRHALQIIKNAKEDLSAKDETHFTLGNQNYTLSRQEFEALIQPLVERALNVCRETLSYSNIDLKDIQGVVMVGGSTRIPLVRQEVEKLFKQRPVTNTNPLTIVAQGAALQAHALTYGSDTLLMDVTPLSLGLEIMGGMVDPLIERNAPLPTRKAKDFTTYKDGQTGLLLHIVQGERDMAKDCRSLGQFKLTGIPPMVAGAARIQVTFQVDSDGLLTVSAREETTGISQHIEVKPSYGLEEDQMRKMIMASLENAQGDVNSRLLAESKVEANRFLESLLPALATDRSLLSDNEYEDILTHLDALDASLKTEDREAILQASKALEIATQPFAERRMGHSIKKALEGKALSAVEKAL
ncbi:MAG TPA: Fe-S protein assembly chaperone HscA [Holosporales bacterium]|nr:Fe-S protein assembly chaperone HscA [Holosporales bacterium]